MKKIKYLLLLIFAMTILMCSSVFAKNNPEIVKTIEKGFKAQSNTINISKYKITYDEAIEHVNEAKNNQYYLLDTYDGCDCLYRYYKIGDQKIMKEILVQYGTTNKNTIKKRKQVIDNGVKKILSGIKKSMTPAEKALYIHDEIIKYVQYDYNNYINGTVPKSSYQMYGFFAKKKVVCMGYSFTYKYLLSKVGIKSIIVSSDAVMHSWNMVYLNKKWYHVDVTWDDVVYLYGKDNKVAISDDVSHKNFLINDKQLLTVNKYKSWKMYNSNESAPKASKKYNFKWSKVDQMYYYNGYWYANYQLNVLKGKFGSTPKIYKKNYKVTRISLTTGKLKFTNRLKQFKL